ncbi:hypothetical protein D9758_004148 [Tetrapyrgos nigripes]|uniref:LysM domain-containing protein n=1 Tax=Tetrapyrgos nigripes TaxID=182062 RepID=A0A8H5LVT2_9AGAR|nr:hypothetical protein D9758_004148 [Tetrapyrgos nigripes]
MKSSSLSSLVILSVLLNAVPDALALPGASRRSGLLSAAQSGGSNYVDVNTHVDVNAAAAAVLRPSAGGVDLTGAVAAQADVNANVAGQRVGASASVCIEYSVKVGDNLQTIASANGVTAHELRSWNSDLDCDKLEVGATLKLCHPSGGSSGPSTGNSGAAVPTYTSSSPSTVPSTATVDAAATTACTESKGAPSGVPTSTPSGVPTSTPSNAPTNSTGSTSPIGVTSPYIGPTCTVQPGDSCYQIATNAGLTLDQLLSYNLGINCNNLQVGTTVQLTPTSAGPTGNSGNTSPVGTPSPSAGSTGNTGHTGSSSTSPSTGNTSTSPVSTTSPTHVVQPGDICYDIALKAGLTVAQLANINAGLNCDNLQVGATLQLTPSSHGSGSSSSSGGNTSLVVVTTPSTGNTGSASTFPVSTTSPTHVVQPGDVCYDIALKAGLTVAQLTSLNVGFDCDNLQVGATLQLIPSSSGSGNSSNNPSGASSSASPSTCSVKHGDTCSSIALNAGLTVAQLLGFNVGLDCGSLQVGSTLNLGPVPDALGGVSGALTGAGSHASGSSPSTCSVKLGDTCDSIALEAGLTVAQLLGFNAGLDCDSLQVGATLNFVPVSGAVSVVAGPGANVSGSSPSTCSVKHGDTCESIVLEAGLTVAQLLGFNLGLNCDSLEVGSILNLGPVSGAVSAVVGTDSNTTASPSTCSVKHDDSCDSIALEAGLTVAQLLGFNLGLDCNSLQVGSILNLGPVAGPVSGAAGAAAHLAGGAQGAVSGVFGAGAHAISGAQGAISGALGAGAHAIGGTTGAAQHASGSVSGASSDSGEDCGCEDSVYKRDASALGA